MQQIDLLEAAVHTDYLDAILIESIDSAKDLRCCCTISLCVWLQMWVEEGGCFLASPYYLETLG